MTPTQSSSAIACAPGALTGGPSRTRFFDGMFLTQADLENEQRFWRLKRRLTNRALGDGVVWGLRLTWNQQRHMFSLTQGYALDCCGNDLIVECPVDVSEAELWSRSDPALRNAGFGIKPGLGNTITGYHPTEAMLTNYIARIPRPDLEMRTRRACVVLQYTECPEDPRTVHRDACAGPTNVCEPSRVRESARLLLVPPPTPRLTPPEQFVAELEAWRDSLDPKLRDQLFPPQGGVPSPASNAVVPMTVLVTIPGSPAEPGWPATNPAPVTIQPKMSGTITSPTFSATQLTDGDDADNLRPRSAVVTFQLQPTSGWGFVGGQVLDHGRVVETVTPPVAPSMYWSFDLARPESGVARADFEYRVDNLDIAQQFGGNLEGKVTLLITGTLTVPATGESFDSRHALVTVENLRVTTVSAEVSESPNEKGCLRELVPWGAIVDPTDGRRLAGTLVLSSLYAFLSEVVQRGASAEWAQVATILYGSAWYAIYGVNGFAQLDDKAKQKLSDLIIDLYKRWCDALAYPGPRCTDEYHGVYLGCVEIDRSGRIVSFDMWEGRRYVVTGALLGYWAKQFGIAPLDVIVGRFAKAICCLAGQPPVFLPSQPGTLYPGIGGDKPGDRFHIGTVDSVNAFAKLHGAKVRWVTPVEIAGRTAEAFMAHDAGRMLEVVATQLEKSGSIAIAVPYGGGPSDYKAIRTDVLGMLRRGELHVYERGRQLVADFVIEAFRHTPPSKLQKVSDAGKKVAQRLDAAGANLADALDMGSEGIVVRVGDPAADIGGADELVDAAELAVDAVVTATVKLLGPKIDRGAFKTNADKIAKAVDPKIGLDPTTLANAASVIGQG